jgi:hypothetical protein
VWFSLWSDAGVPSQRYSTLSPKRSHRSIKLILVLTVIGAIIYLGFIYVDVTDRKWGDSSSQKDHADRTPPAPQGQDLRPICGVGQRLSIPTLSLSFLVLSSRHAANV